MFVVEPATHDDIDRLVELEAGLFREDAGLHEKFADVTWPEREGRDDFERLLADPKAIVLVARAGKAVVGLVVGAYVANQGAQRFYGRHGFEPQSVSRVLRL